MPAKVAVMIGKLAMTAPSSTLAAVPIPTHSTISGMSTTLGSALTATTNGLNTA